MKNVFIDIETAPGSQWFQDKLALDVQPPGNYKNPEAILKWWDEVGNAKREEAHKMASLSPFCNIICIGWAVEDGPLCSSTGATEHEVLSNFAEALRKDLTDHTGFHNPRYVGHNILGFDMPRLFQRMIVNGVHPDFVRIKSPNLIKGWDDAFYDTMLTFGGRDTTGCSLGNLCKEFKIEDKMPDMDGSKVYGLYQEGRIAEIAAYCREDVRLTRELYKHLECVGND